MSSLVNENMGAAVYSNANLTSWQRTGQICMRSRGLLHEWAHFGDWHREIMFACRKFHAVRVNNTSLFRTNT